ncbi:MAG: hypothetical protein HYX37_02630 [Rhizobiales bacterium]|nr:hypothetical protein [Hyphomicrobiales bacterium]
MRYVAQEVLNRLQQSGPNGDRIVAAIITALCKGAPPAHQEAREAIERLKRQHVEDRQERDAQAAREREEREQKERERDAIAQRRAEQKAGQRDGLMRQFEQMVGQTDRQARGFALERLLNDLFDHEDLAPRGSFRITGEQIDGSFAWGNQTHLLEARWRDAPVAGDGFATLDYKTSGKTVDTRGLFISINGYSKEALQGLAKKGELRFVCLDGAHLMRCLQPGGSLRKTLEEVWRHAGETGEAFLPASSMRR